MSRREEVEAILNGPRREDDADGLCYTLADEIDALRAEADLDALTICYMQGQAQGDAEARAAQEVVTKLLAMLKDNKPGRIHGVTYYTDAQNKQAELYHRACKIAGRTE